MYINMPTRGGGPGGGAFYFGDYGFLYKKKGAIGARRSTRFAAGGTAVTNTNQYIYNKYQSGNSGIGGSSIAVRRAKNRLATVCEDNKCGNFYNRLGLYTPYIYNPNGYVPIQYGNNYNY
jgi:hypothetical protein